MTGDDEVAQYANREMNKRGLEFTFLTDTSRPTTFKQRFRAGSKTLLRVSHLRQHGISSDLAEEMFEKIETDLDQTDVLIFSDFNYGCLPQTLVDRVRESCIKHEVMMVADSQASSQASDVSRFKNMRLLTPTEHEARLAVRDSQSGLAMLADVLHQKSDAEFIVITLGSEGALIYAPNLPSGSITIDRLPAFNTAPKDVTGAGDSLLACMALALATGADIWHAAYLGSLAAAFQVGRIGNHGIAIADLLTELDL